MPAKYLVDSDICIGALGGRTRESRTSLISRIHPEGLAISVITYGEVVDGLLNSRQRALDLQRWSAFLDAFDVVNVTVDIADVWAELRGRLRRAGNTVPDNDLLIASTALTFGMTLVTGNARHYRRVDDLPLVIA